MAARKPPKNEGDPLPTGRPSSFTPELGDKICAELADGNSLRAILACDGMPGMETVYRWLRTNDSFRDQYAIAREDQADTLADEITDIADEPPGTSDKGAIDAGAVAHQRLRVDARKWVAAKLKPKKYGDKLEVEGKGMPLVVIKDLSGA